jgi:hypothetical protein
MFEEVRPSIHHCYQALIGLHMDLLQYLLYHERLPSASFTASKRGYLEVIHRKDSGALWWRSIGRQVASSWQNAGGRSKYY